jgi:sugar lactone lactonase YvrE
MRSIRFLVAVAALVLAMPLSSAGAARPFPERIPLPDGFQPEGIAIGPRATFYVGSIPTGAVYRGSLRTGAGSVLVPAQAGRSAIGIDIDRRGRLFVAGGATGGAFVYDADTGGEVAAYEFAESPTFVNDVVVTRTAAWFTDSLRPFLYRVAIAPSGALGPAEAIPLTGDIVYGPGFNVNGIDATPNGKTLVIVQSNAGKLFTVDASGRTREIDLAGASVTAGDGVLLDGRTLYVVRNVLNQIAVVELRPGLSAGTVVGTITHPTFAVPTTIDEFGRRLYAVNARFGTAPTPETDYWLTQVRKVRGKNG